MMLSTEYEEKVSNASFTHFCKAALGEAMKPVIITGKGNTELYQGEISL